MAMHHTIGQVGNPEKNNKNVNQLCWTQSSRYVSQNLLPKIDLYKFAPFTQMESPFRMMMIIWKDCVAGLRLIGDVKQMKLISVSSSVCHMF